MDVCRVNLALLLVAAVSAAATAIPDRPVERIIRIDIPGHEVVYSLARQASLSVIDANDRFMRAYADDAQIDAVRALGYQVRILVEDYQAQAALDLVNYYTYAQVCSTLHSLALTYPLIARLETLGLSYGSRPIPAMKVTLDPASAHTRPRVRLVGAHHGNEKISTEITLSFLKYLLENYASNQQVKGLVDTREVWVIPIVNPDGHVSNSRYNGAGRDLNRDYGYEWENYSEPFTQPETRAVRENSEKHMFSAEFTYHSDASYVNYLWDNHPSLTPDSSHILDLSIRYMDSTYGSSLTQLDTINGFRWYEVHGSCQDHTFGVYGGLAWTIETDLPSTRVRIDSICLANRRALLDFVTMAGWGVSGVVYDSLTLTPLFARVEFTNPVRWPCFANLTTGDFHKMLSPGSYALRVWANGYEPRSFNVNVPDTGSAAVTCAMLRAEPDPLCHAQKTVALRREDYGHAYSDWVYRAYGAPDSLYYSLGSSTSSLVLDLDPLMPACNRPGNDVTVHALGSYSASAANNWRGPWTLLGNVSGTASFDLGSVAMDSARYLKIQNSSSCRLDAVSYASRPTSGCKQSPVATAPDHLSAWPSPSRGRVLVTLPASPRPQKLRLFDAIGRQVSDITVSDRTSGSVVFTGLCPGVYVARYGSVSARFVVAR